MLVQQVNQNLKCKLEQKTEEIQAKYQQTYEQELSKLKKEWEQKHLTLNANHNAQLSKVLKDIEALKQHTQLKDSTAEGIEPGAKVSGLQQKVFGVVPGTVNTRRGAAINLQDETVDWSKVDNPPTVPPAVASCKHVHFTSTLLKPANINLFDADDDHTIIGHLPPNAPETDANSLITNTFTAVASEFKKMHEPKIQKLKGGTSSSASLFFNSWVKDIRLTIEERGMNNTKSLQLLKVTSKWPWRKATSPRLLSMQAQVAYSNSPKCHLV